MGSGIGRRRAQNRGVRGAENVLRATPMNVLASMHTGAVLKSSESLDRRAAMRGTGSIRDARVASQVKNSDFGTGACVCRRARAGDPTAAPITLNQKSVPTRRDVVSCEWQQIEHWKVGVARGHNRHLDVISSISHASIARTNRTRPCTSAHPSSAWTPSRPWPAASICSAFAWQDRIWLACRP